MTQDHKLAKANQTKPNKDILGPFLGLFDPFLTQKYQKITPQSTHMDRTYFGSLDPGGIHKI